MHLNNVFKRLLIKMDYSDLSDIHRLQAVFFIAPLATLVHFLLIPFFYYTGAEILSLVNVGSVAVWIYGIWLSKCNRINLAIQFFCGEVLLHSLIVTYYLGPDPGFQYYLWSMAGLAVMDTSSSRLRVFITATLLVIVFSVLNIGIFEPAHPFPYASYLPFMKLFNMLVAGILSIMAIMIMRSFHLCQQAELKVLAYRDSLTGLYNRRQGVALLEQARQRAEIDQKPLTIVMADIDHFKAINDQFGHSAGDAVLCRIGKVLQSSFRKSDTVIRWGGEEFLIMFPNALENHTEQFLDTVSSRLRKMDFKEELPQCPVTLSYGVAQWRPGELIEQCIKRADEALYISKQNGRNRITFAQADQDESSEKQRNQPGKNSS